MSGEEYPVFDEETSFGESPFESAEFVENPEPRCPCVLLLDTSSSMEGAPIASLQEGLRHFREALLTDELAAKRVEVAVVAFGPVRLVSDFQTPEFFSPPELEADGDTPLGEAVELALEMVEERKEIYRDNGINYYRPWVFLITDGAPSGPWENAAELVKVGEDNGAFAFFPVAVEGADMDVLDLLSTRQALKLDGLRFQDLFSWLSKSLQMVSHSQLGSEIDLPSPAGWATV